jgi:hypothetical protein
MKKIPTVAQTGTIHDFDPCSGILGRTFGELSSHVQIFMKDTPNPLT